MVGVALPAHLRVGTLAKKIWTPDLLGQVLGRFALVPVVVQVDFVQWQVEAELTELGVGKTVDTLNAAALVPVVVVVAGIHSWV